MLRTNSRPFRSFCSRSFLAVGCLVVVSQTASAQVTSSLFGSSGPLSAASSSRGSSMSSMSSMSGLSGMSGMSGMSGRSGMTNGMSSLTGGAASGLQTGAGMSSFGQQQNQGGFIGQNFGTGTFVGQNNRAQTGGAQGMNNQGMNRGRGGQGQNQFNQFGQNGQMQGGMTSTTPQIRPQQKVAFDFPAPPAATMQATAQIRLSKVSLKQPSLSGVQISMAEGGVAVLRGSVKTTGDQKLAEQLLRLEPGVRSVKNELTVATP